MKKYINPKLELYYNEQDVLMVSELDIQDAEKTTEWDSNW